MATDAQLAEQIRGMIPDIAYPLRPGELVSVWIERASRACGVAPSRLRSYWHRKVEAPKASEYLAVLGAAEAAARRRQAIENLENEIAARADQLRRDHTSLTERVPVFARYLPVPPSVETVTPGKVVK